MPQLVEEVAQPRESAGASFSSWSTNAAAAALEVAAERYGNLIKSSKNRGHALQYNTDKEASHQLHSRRCSTATPPFFTASKSADFTNPFIQSIKSSLNSSNMRHQYNLMKGNLTSKYNRNSSSRAIGSGADVKDFGVVDPSALSLRAARVRAPNSAVSLPSASNFSERPINEQVACMASIKFTVRAERFHAVLTRPDVDIKELRELLWSGVPPCCPPSVRSDAWRIVLGYLPSNRDRAFHVLAKKRSEYEELVQHYYLKERFSVDELKLQRQLRLDLPRTHAGHPFFTHPLIQSCMERALFLWAVKNPASGYVQGINDLITPFFAVFFASAVGAQVESVSVDTIPVEILTEIEADAFWCLSKLLAHIQDHFTFGQPGIQRAISKLSDIVRRVDERLYGHLRDEGVDLLQVSFRWMNCLLMREFPMRCVIRLWDTYIAEQQQAEGFSTFHVYVCAVFLVYWSARLREMNFQQIMLFIQNFPTASWTEQEVETLLAEAFVLKSLFHSSPKHLSN